MSILNDAMNRTADLLEDGHEEVTLFDFYKRGRMVTCNTISGRRLNPRSQLDKVGTLPEAYRPIKQLTVNCTWGNYGNVTGLIRIDTNGDIYIYASTAQSNVECWAVFTYPVE